MIIDDVDDPGLGSGERSGVAAHVGPRHVRDEPLPRVNASGITESRSVAQRKATEDQQWLRSLY